MKLAAWANIYKCPYFLEWKEGIANQLDMDFSIYYSTLEGANKTLDIITQEYDAVLCLDIDDIPEPALTHIAKINARKHDITAFAMKIIDEDNKQMGYFGKLINISDYNIWGFGNTVWKSKTLRDVLPIDFETYPADWNTVTHAYNNGAHLHFEPLPLIRYRQYGQADNRLVQLGDKYVWK
jgi:hypothetical protein